VFKLDFTLFFYITRYGKIWKNKIWHCIGVTSDFTWTQTGLSYEQLNPGGLTMGDKINKKSTVW
jgi:hypothetical protein